MASTRLWRHAILRGLAAGLQEMSQAAATAPGYAGAVAKALAAPVASQPVVIRTNRRNVMT